MNAAFLSLGGNMGNRRAHLSAALQAIALRCGSIVKASSVYETAAWGVEGAQSYLNQVIKIETNLSPRSLLAALLSIEKEAGRVRDGQQYADRVIDLDILFFNNAVIREGDLQVPHPRLHLRKFALVPLAEIEEGLLHPRFNKTIAELLAACNDPLNVSRVAD